MAVNGASALTHSIRVPAAMPAAAPAARPGAASQRRERNGAATRATRTARDMRRHGDQGR